MNWQIAATYVEVDGYAEVFSDVEVLGHLNSPINKPAFDDLLQWVKQQIGAKQAEPSGAGRSRAGLFPGLGDTPTDHPAYQPSFVASRDGVVDGRGQADMQPPPPYSPVEDVLQTSYYSADGQRLGQDGTHETLPVGCVQSAGDGASPPPYSPGDESIHHHGPDGNRLFSTVGVGSNGSSGPDLMSFGSAK